MALAHLRSTWEHLFSSSTAQRAPPQFLSKHANLKAILTESLFQRLGICGKSSEVCRGGPVHPIAQRRLLQGVDFSLYLT